MKSKRKIEGMINSLKESILDSSVDFVTFDGKKPGTYLPLLLVKDKILARKLLQWVLE